MSTIAITAHIPNKHDATALYRATGPLGHMRKSNDGFNWQIQTASEFSAPVAMLTDVAFFQRPSTPPELEAMRIFKRLGVPVIVDYDDLLFDVPQDNPAHRAYMNKQTQETVVSCMREADAIFVSTSELKRCIQLPKNPLNARVYVVPNALDERHIVRADRAQPPTQRNRTVLWRGSPTHERDVMEYVSELIDSAAFDRTFSFTFAGWNPWWLTERMGPQQAIVSPQLSVGEFMDFLYATAPAIGMVPLHKSRFNLCKSNIAWLEMSWAGAACLVPDWEEWRNPGVVSYKNTDDFKKGLLWLLGMSNDDRAELNRMSWEHIVDHYTLKHTNRIRQEVFLAAACGTPWPDGGAPISDPVMELE